MGATRRWVGLSWALLAMGAGEARGDASLDGAAVETRSASRFGSKPKAEEISKLETRRGCLGS